MKKLWRKARMRIDRVRINIEVYFLLRSARRKQQLHDRVPNPGYDELSCPIFLGTMCLALLVLVVEVRDAWPAVTAFFTPLITRVAGA